jgi:tRNA pseudouridine32 synthase/23S rRNA pseudouridine746 synthase
MLDLFFENENVVVVDKLGSMLSVPSRLGVADPRPCVGILLEAQLKQQIYPCHRLDECVSGLIIYAKNPNAHRILNHCFEHSLVIKHYYAWSSSALQIPSIQSNFHWETMLYKGKKRAYADPKLGKHSVTDAQLIEIQNHCLFWRLSPKTGRSHQLRFELFDHGFPIWGDHLYGSPYLYQNQEDGIALKMVHFDFQHCPKALDLGIPKTLTTSLPTMPDLPLHFQLKNDQTLPQMQAFQKRRWHK